MAGRQQKNGFASSVVLDGTQENYRVKRIKSGFLQCDLDMKPCISLKWDDNKKSVVAKTEQIGLSRRELIHFADVIRPRHDIVADVITVPPEIFTLDNLDDVLTYEVWQNCLSESERSILTQFLPKNCNPDRVVKQLLRGDNFHFGNQYLKWGTLLCSRNLHPDNILTTERCFRTNKKAYYAELQTYHTDMIDSLQRWKERVVDCKDLKEDIIQWTWRSRSNSKKRVFKPETRVPELEENVFATPESSCRAASEMVCSSDNPNGILMHGEISIRKGSTTSKIDNPDGKDVSKPRKEEKLLKHSIHHGGGARYMSYIKVSKSQHQRIKSSMKHSSSSIQAKSLYSVLGNIDTLHIQPFEVYEKEEWQKLHDHWLQLATRDLPQFVADWKNLKLQRLQMTKSLGRELEERLKCQKESFDQDKEETSCDRPLELLDNFDANSALTKMEDLDVAPSMPAVDVLVSTFKETPLIIEEQAPSTGMTLAESPSMTEEEAPAMTKEESPAMTEEESPAMTNEESSNLTKENEVQCNGLMEEQQDNRIGEVGLLTFEDKVRENSIRDAGDFVSVPTQSDLMHQTTSLINGCHHYDDMDIETHGNLDLKKEESSLSSSKYSLNLGNVDVPVSQEDSIASDVDTWPQVNMPGLFYHSTSLSHGYSSSNELSLGHPQVEEHTSQLLHLEAFNLERMGERVALDAFNGESIGGRDALQLNSSPSPFFSPYHNQERNELYQPFYKSETDLSYQHDQKQAGTSFQPAANVLVETDQCSALMKEQMHSSLPLELRQKGLGDIFLNQNIQESMYSNGVSYPIPRLETLPLNVRDWAPNTVHMSAAPPPPPQSHMNDGLLNPNWYAGDNPARGSWSCMEGGGGPNQGIGSGSSSDQSLFRVLSECNELQAGAHYDPMSSSRRLMQSGNYGGVTGGVHTTSHMLPQTVNSLNYLADLESAAGYKTASSIGMMNIQHQTPGLEETIDNKTFLRSWNK